MIGIIFCDVRNRTGQACLQRPVFIYIMGIKMIKSG